MPEERRGIQSVEIAFRILQALQDSERPLPLREVAAGAGLSPSAVNNYLVSLVRTGLAATDEKPGHYRLGPAAITLGQRAIRQIDGFEVMRRVTAALRDATGHSAAVTTWTPDGPISLFKLEGNDRRAFELRTGLLSVRDTAAGRVLAACLPDAEVMPFIEREATARAGLETTAAFLSAVREEVARQGFVRIRRQDGTGYVSAAAPVRDWSGEVRFALSLIGSQTSLSMETGSPEIRALLDQAALAAGALAAPDDERRAAAAPRKRRPALPA